MSEFSRMCRLCLQEEINGTDKQLYDVFSFEQNHDLKRKIAICTGVMLLPEDPIPSLICETCITTVEKFDSFLMKVRNSDMFLTSIYSINESIEDNERNDSTINDGNEDSDNKSNKLKNETDEYISCDSSSSLNEDEAKSLNELPKPVKTKSSCVFFHREKFVAIPDEDYEEKNKEITTYSRGMSTKSSHTFINYQNHEATNNERQFVYCCPKCEEIFSSRGQLLEHEKTHKVPCSNGCQTETLPRSLSEDMLRHTDKFKCTECEATFSSKIILERHISALHMKKNACQVCSKKNRCQSSVNRHTAFHSSNRQQKCKHCDFVAKSASTLQVHVKRKHTGQKSVCEICAKVFKSELGLRQHMKRIHQPKKHRRHTKEWFPVCKVCSWEFLTVKELKQHMLTHKQNYSKCPKCHKQFVLKKHYEKHLTICTKKMKGGKYSLKNSTSMPEASVKFN